MPPTNQMVLSQEPGLRPARALPYELHADGTTDVAGNAFRIDFANTGKAGACFQVRSGNTAEGPWSYTVEVDKSLSNSWNLAATQGQYDLSVFGPNGFFRQFRGTVSRHAKADLDVNVRYDVDDDAIVLRVTNRARVAARVHLTSAYSRRGNEELRPGQALEKHWPLKENFGWYDLSVTTDVDANFLRRVAGHLENGRDSASDPAFGGFAHDLHERTEKLVQE